MVCIFMQKKKIKNSMMCKDGAKEIIINAENYNIFPSTVPHETCLNTPWGIDMPLFMNHCAVQWRVYSVYEKKSAE